MGGLIVGLMIALSALVGVSVRYVDSWFHLSRTRQEASWGVNCATLKRALARYYADHPDLVTTLPSGDEVALPLPAGATGLPDVNYVTTLVGEGPYGEEVQYFNWDLRTDTPPRDELVMRFAAGGYDKTVVTNIASTYCEDDDLCCDITSAELLARSAAVLPAPNQNGPELPDPFAFPSDPKTTCLWTTPGAWGQPCTYANPCSLSDVMSRISMGEAIPCVVLKPGDYSIETANTPYTLQVSSNQYPVTFIGEAADFSNPQCEQVGTCAAIPGLIVKNDYKLAFVGIKFTRNIELRHRGLKPTHVVFHNVIAPYINLTIPSITSYLIPSATIDISKSIINGFYGSTYSELSDQLLYITITETHIQGSFHLIEAQGTAYSGDIQIKISSSTLDGCFRFVSDYYAWKVYGGGFRIELVDSQIKGSGCTAGVDVAWQLRSSYDPAWNQLYISGIQIGSTTSGPSYGIKLSSYYGPSWITYARTTPAIVENSVIYADTGLWLYPYQYGSYTAQNNIITANNCIQLIGSGASSKVTLQNNTCLNP